MNNSHRNVKGPSDFEAAGHIATPKRRRGGEPCESQTCKHGTLDCANTRSRYELWQAGEKP